MYLLIAFFIVKHYKTRGVVILLIAGVVTTLCDQTASHLIKNAVQRLRPSHEPALAGLIHLSKAGAGGMYGFVSSHAANAFGLTSFLFFALDNKFKFLKYWLFYMGCISVVQPYIQRSTLSGRCYCGCLYWNTYRIGDVKTILLYRKQTL
jgi:undecaprenyl-diphosphatase